MRDLSLTEMDLISGGINCIDYPTFQKMQSEGRQDGYLWGTVGAALVGTFVGFATFGAAGAVAVGYGIAAGALTFPVGFLWGYNNSGVWTVWTKA